jgi:hypothetical protein
MRRTRQRGDKHITSSLQRATNVSPHHCGDRVTSSHRHCGKGDKGRRTRHCGEGDKGRRTRHCVSGRRTHHIVSAAAGDERVTSSLRRSRHLVTSSCSISDIQGERTQAVDECYVTNDEAFTPNEDRVPLHTRPLRARRPHRRPYEGNVRLFDHRRHRRIHPRTRAQRRHRGRVKRGPAHFGHAEFRCWDSGHVGHAFEHGRVHHGHELRFRGCLEPVPNPHLRGPLIGSTLEGPVFDIDDERVAFGRTSSTAG